MGREAFQELDYSAVFGTMAKWVVQIDDPARVPELISRAFVSTVWNTLILLIVLGSWFCILLPFIASQAMLSRIIKHAKKERLTSLNQSIDNLLYQIQNGDSQSFDQLERMQKLSESIFHSPASVTNLNIIGKFASSVIMTLIPMLLNWIFG